MSWQQPIENSVDSLTYAISHFDGVELDLRLSNDGVLMMHHDDQTVDKTHVETMTADDLDEYCDSFSSLLEKKSFTEPWQEEGKTVCIELKSPHPRSGKGGGWRAGAERISHITQMLKLVNNHLSELELPEGTTVAYSFDPRFLTAAKRANFPHPRARLMPYLREWGNSKMKRVVAAPSFAFHSLPRLMGKHKKWGAPMVPCALEYLTGWTRWVTLGKTVGLKGKQLDRLTKNRKGYPAFVWPSRLSNEGMLMDAGLTALTDDADPSISHLPDGRTRNTRPATEPKGDGVP